MMDSFKLYAREKARVLARALSSYQAAHACMHDRSQDAGRPAAGRLHARATGGAAAAVADGGGGLALVTWVGTRMPGGPWCRRGCGSC
jgi:hypothetical protein